MHLLVVEESPLWSVPTGVTDHLGDGRTVSHGPWSAPECSALLGRWLAAGWLELYLPDLPEGWNLQRAEWLSRANRRAKFLMLDTNDSEELLAAPDRWIVGSIDGQVCLCRSDAGMDHTASEWYSASTP